MKKLIFIFISTIFCFANSCNVEYDVIYTIAKVEGHPKRNVGYPFIISFNNKLDIHAMEKISQVDYEKLDSRSIDCKNKKMCIKILKHLIDNGIKNLDLGAFQFNYRFIKFKDLSQYFDLKYTYYKTCKILMDLEKKYGWSMQTLAKYHSYTDTHNQKYQKIITEKYKEIYAKNQ